MAAGELHRVRALAWGVRRQMLADIMFRKSENDAAIYHFEQFLQQKPRRVLKRARILRAVQPCVRALARLRSCVLVRIIICVRSHYVALARLTTLLRRAGRLDEAPRHIKVH